MQTRRSSRALLATCVALAALGPLLPAAADDRFEAARQFYEERVQRPSLYKRTEGRRTLAHTRDPRAIDILAKDYANAEAPAEEVRETIVAMMLKYRWRGSANERIVKWREAERHARDAWLWYRSTRLEVAADEPELARAAVTAEESPWIQEAAFRALAPEGGEDLLLEIPERLEKLLGPPKTDDGKRRRPKPPRRGRKPKEPPPLDEALATAALRLENTARVLLALEAEHDSEAWKAAAIALLQYFDATTTSPHTRFVLARCIAAAVGVAMSELSKEEWIREVMAGGSGAGASDSRYPSFAGLEAHGTRIVYVVDFSDSMLTPLETKERAPVITGGSGADGDGLPWGRIRTRFDLARELLKASIERLSEDKLFAVVWFGDDAKTLSSTRKLIPANQENIRAVIEELNAIRPGAPGTGTTRFEYGSLRGETNLHGGMRLAFRLSEQGDLGEDAYVSLDALVNGVESVFLFSDGLPTTDNWVKVDTRDNESAVTDRETNTPADATPMLSFPGPYSYRHEPFILDDLERRNLFRTVEIHCVGIGSADMSLLERVAHIGGGQARQLGSDRK